MFADVFRLSPWKEMKWYQWYLVPHPDRHAKALRTASVDAPLSETMLTSSNIMSYLAAELPFELRWDPTQQCNTIKLLTL